MHSEVTKFENRAAWLGYLGILPFLAGFILLFNTNTAAVALEGIRNYAALILTFVGAIHWGRAMSSASPSLLSLSVLPSLLAWCTLFLAAKWALPVLMCGFLALYMFDHREYQDATWFQRLRAQLTLSVCVLLMLSWFITF